MPKFRKIPGVENVWSFSSNIDKINKEIAKGERRNRLKATRHMVSALKKRVKKEYGEGNLYEGIGLVHYKDLSKFGFKRPAQHAHLIEFGTDERFVKKWLKTNMPHAVGYMKKNPIFKETVLKEQGAVKAILSQPWVK